MSTVGNEDPTAIIVGCPCKFMCTSTFSVGVIRDMKGDLHEFTILCHNYNY